MRRLLILVALWGLSGCAVHRALHEGEKLAAAGNWPEAHEVYLRTASAFPTSEVAQERVTLARRAAREVWLTRAVEAMERSDWDGARTALAACRELAPSDPRLLELERRIPWARVAEIRSMAELGQVQLAWREAVALHNDDPTHPGARKLREEMRYGVIQEAYRRYDKGQPQSAAEHLGVLLEAEPELAPSVEAKISELKHAWAASLRRRWARAEEQGTPATAFAASTVAAWLGDDPRDLEARDRLRRAFEADHAAKVWLGVKGPRSESRRWEQTLSRELSGPTLVTRVRDPEGADLVGRIEVSPPRCMDAPSGVDTKSVDVSRGAETTDNPSWARREREILALEAQIEQLRKAPDGGPELEQARVELRAAFDALPALREAEVAARASVESDPDAWDQASAAMIAGQERAQRAREVVRTLESAADPDESALLALQEELEVARRALSETPRTITRARTEQRTLEVFHFTRTCELAVQVALDGLAPVALSETQVQRDSRHAALVEAGIDEDPLEFALTSSEFAANAEVALMRKVRRLLGRALDNERTKRLQTAADGDVEMQLSSLLGAWLLDPERVPRGLDALLEAEFGWSAHEAFLEAGPTAQR